MRKKKFQRSDVKKYSKLGLRRKKLIKYRKARGRDNKIRLKKKGHLRNVSIGFRSPKKTRGLVNGLKPVLIHNLKELKNLKKDEIGILAKIGNRKKVEIANYVKEKQIKLLNLNPKKFLKEVEIKMKKKKIKQEVRKKVKLNRDKKAKKKHEKDMKSNNKEKTESPKKDEKNENKTKDNQNETKKLEDKKQKEPKKEIQTNNYGRGK